MISRIIKVEVHVRVRLLDYKARLFWISQNPNLIIVLIYIQRKKMVTTVSGTGNLFVNV